jgi:hypothetical protein
LSTGVPSRFGTPPAGDFALTLAAFTLNDRLLATVHLVANILVWLLLLAPLAVVALMAGGFNATKRRKS